MPIAIQSASFITHASCITATFVWRSFFAARCGISYQKLLDDERIGFATVKIEAEYFVPLVYGDTAEVELVINNLGRSSAHFNYSVKRSGDDVLCATSTQIQVAMDIDKRIRLARQGRSRATARIPLSGKYEEKKGEKQ